jgi:hypothetical protein
MNETIGDPPDVWLDTLRTCPEHSAMGQPLLDAARGESQRMSGVLRIIESVVGLDARTANEGAWSFDATRIAGTDERVLRFRVGGLNAPQRSNVQSAADVQFGAGAVIIEAG